MTRSQEGNIALLRNRLRVILKGLPQYALVKEQVEPWIDHVLTVDPDRAEFHANRLGGFSSSEIGVLVSNAEGEYDKSGSASDIVSSKLLKSFPSDLISVHHSNETRRDVFMEPIHRQLFIEKHARLGCAIDNDLMYKFLKARGPRAWMRYCPDDVVVMKNMEGRPRVLVDYIHPSYVPDGEKVGFGHVCQMTQGRMVADHNAFPIQMMWLSQLNYESFTATVSNIQYDLHLAKRIIEAGDYYWDRFVLAGDVPAPIVSGHDLVRQIFPVAPGEINIDRSEALPIEVLRNQQGAPALASAMRG